MSWLMLILSLGLAAMWIIALATQAAQGWVIWLMFTAAVVLMVMAGVNMAIMKRHTGKPV